MEQTQQKLNELKGLQESYTIIAVECKEIVGDIQAALETLNNTLELL